MTQVLWRELRVHAGTALLRHGYGLLVVVEHELTSAALGAFYRVYNKLGYGFLEAVYVNALAVELERSGRRVQRELPIEVMYDGVVVGHYRADIIVDGRLILEVKGDSHLAAGPERQLMNYLRCTELEVGLLLMFGIKPRFKRLIHTRDRKLFTNKESTVSA